jgi:hypothetical protein
VIDRVVADQDYHGPDSGPEASGLAFAPHFEPIDHRQNLLHGRCTGVLEVTAIDNAPVYSAIFFQRAGGAYVGEACTEMNARAEWQRAVSKKMMDVFHVGKFVGR